MVLSDTGGTHEIARRPTKCLRERSRARLSDAVCLAARTPQSAPSEPAQTLHAAFCCCCCCCCCFSLLFCCFWNFSDLLLELHPGLKRKQVSSCDREFASPPPQSCAGVTVQKRRRLPTEASLLLSPGLQVSQQQLWALVAPHPLTQSCVFFLIGTGNTMYVQAWSCFVPCFT